MGRLPDDLVEFVRRKRLGDNQKTDLRDLSSESADEVSADEYMRRYVRRVRKIRHGFQRPDAAS